MSRAPKSPIIYQEKLKLSKETIRFATPKEPALYRAQRLKCKTIAEIGAGIGGQTLAFAKTCKKVIAVEINPEDAKILKQNLLKLKITNVEVIVGDALNQKIIDRIKSKKPEIIFCDTARKPEGERKIKDIEPNIKKLLEEYFPITKKIAIEIPPFTSDTETLKETSKKNSYH
jgi:predicted RNA methylase